MPPRWVSWQERVYGIHKRKYTRSRALQEAGRDPGAAQYIITMPPALAEELYEANAGFKWEHHPDGFLLRRVSENPTRVRGWTPEMETEILKKRVPDKELARKFGKTVAAITSKRHELRVLGYREADIR